jgi:hypothetical protein
MTTSGFVYAHTFTLFTFLKLYGQSKVHDHVVEILDETKRISQDDLAVCKVVALVSRNFISSVHLTTYSPKVQNDFPELKKFHNGWPIRELAQQYLSNRISYQMKIEKDIGLGAGERERRYKKIQNLVKGGIHISCHLTTKLIFQMLIVAWPQGANDSFQVATVILTTSVIAKAKNGRE